MTEGVSSITPGSVVSAHHVELIVSPSAKDNELAVATNELDKNIPALLALDAIGTTHSRPPAPNRVLSGPDARFIATLRSPSPAAAPSVVSTSPAMPRRHHGPGRLPQPQCTPYTSPPTTYSLPSPPPHSAPPLRSNLSVGKVLCNKCGLYERAHSRPRPSQLYRNRESPPPSLEPPDVVLLVSALCRTLERFPSPLPSATRSFHGMLLGAIWTGRLYSFGGGNGYSVCRAVLHASRLEATVWSALASRSSESPCVLGYVARRGAQSSARADGCRAVPYTSHSYLLLQYLGALVCARALQGAVAVVCPPMCVVPYFVGIFRCVEGPVPAWIGRAGVTATSNKISGAGVHGLVLIVGAGAL
ncbi:hypothetical protein C8R46DRAFT_1208270 [Mycena filopes]|nr:hypothetical protein C8R46DRAFT_1208270 [Mycena filopes]